MNILNLPDWTAKEVDNQEEETVVEAVCDIHPTACIKCGSIGNLNGGLLRFGTNRIRIADTPAHGKRFVIEVLRQRYRCRDCGSVFVQPLPDIDERGTMTTRLVGYIKRQSLKRTFVSIAEEVGVTEGTVRNLFHTHIKHLGETFVFHTPRVLGIDELKLCGEMRGVLTNIEARTVVDIMPHRTLDAVNRRFLSLPDRGRVEVVTMDMWNPYRDAARAVFPKAAIVVDKKHVLGLADAALQRVRRDLRASASAKMGRGLMRSRAIVEKRARNLTEQQLLLRDVWFQQFPVLANAYWLKETFYDIYDAETPAEARALYLAWIDRVTVELRPEFTELTTAMRRWDAEIFAYFDHRVTNAYTEAFNGLVKIANRLGRGYSFEVIRAKMLYTHGTMKPQNANRVKETAKKESAKMQIVSLHGPFFTDYANDHITGLGELIHGIPIDQVFITINYDDHLEKAVESMPNYG